MAAGTVFHYQAHCRLPGNQYNRMGDLSILVWNCNEFNTPHKSTSVLTLLCHCKIDMALLQETHLLRKDSARMANRLHHTIASSSVDSKNKGVAIVCKS